MLNWRGDMCTEARRLHRERFQEMATGGEWTLYRANGATAVQLLRDGEPVPDSFVPIVSHVSAMDETTLTSRVWSALSR